jgi:hypothetical protein
MRWVLCMAITRPWPCQFVLDECIEHLVKYTSTHGASSLHVLLGISGITTEQASLVVQKNTHAEKIDHCAIVVLPQPFRGKGKSEGYNALFQHYRQISEVYSPATKEEPHLMIFGTEELRWKVPDWDIHLESAVISSDGAASTNTSTKALWVLSRSTSKWDSQGLIVAIDPEHHPTPTLFPADYPGGTEPLLDLVTLYEANSWIPWKRTDSWVVPKHPLELSFHVRVESKGNYQRGRSVEYGGSIIYDSDATYGQDENEISLSHVENFGHFRKVANFTRLTRD